MESRLRQIIRQKLEETGEPLTPEEEIEAKKMEEEDTPSRLSSLQDKAAPLLTPRLSQSLPPIAPRKKSMTEEIVTKNPSGPVSVPPTTKPAAFNKSTAPRPWKDISKEIGDLRAEMPAEQRASFDNEYQDIERMRAQAINSFKADKQSQDWGKVAEMLGRAAMKLAAGYSGLKSGADLTGAVDAGEKWDWKSDYDALKDELATTLDNAEARRKTVTRKEDRLHHELDASTGAMRKERSALEDDRRKRDMNAENRQTEETKANTKDKEKEDRFYAAKNLEAVQKELDALDRVKSGITRKGKLSRDALTTDLAGMGIDLSTIPEAKGTFWGTKGSDSIDAAELGKVLAAHGAKLRARRDQLLQGQASETPSAPATPGVEEERVDPKTGKIAIFKDKKFVRWK